MPFGSTLPRNMVHIGLILIKEMDLTDRIVASSHMAHIVLHGYFVLRYSLITRNHITIVIRLIDRLSPRNLRR